ncbi:ParB/RepB/Spo0J family partition protein [Candidatus Dojkabacteria bacterium]|nr:ParB/RepB/Spo0J family partition protein [Candidatus Dojkabacteria bacterium]
MTAKKLGSGLSSLISESTIEEIEQAYIPNFDISKIDVNPYQPRMEMKNDELLELADSIREHGVIEPLIITKTKDGEYHLIAGERRLRASRLAKLKTVPVVIKEASPQQVLELAVVENVQRADLNPLEEGMAYDQLAQEFKLTHAEIAKKVGLSRPAIANKIRLLNLPSEIKKGLLEGEIDEGHARALLGLNSNESMVSAYQMIVKDHLSVRAVEELVRRLSKGPRKQVKATDRLLDSYTQEVETTLQNFFSQKTTLFRSRKGGKIVIPFTSDKELEEIVSKLRPSR